MQILNILTGVAASQNAAPPTTQDIWHLAQAYTALKIASSGSNG